MLGEIGLSFLLRHQRTSSAGKKPQIWLSAGAAGRV